VSRRFSTRAGPGESGDITKEVQKDATVEKVNVRFYPGVELALELRPFIEPEDSEDRIDIVELVGRDTIVGNDDHFDFPVADEIQRGDTIGVEFENTDSQYGYDVICDIVVERAGGTERFVEALGGDAE